MTSSKHPDDWLTSKVTTIANPLNNLTMGTTTGRMSRYDDGIYANIAYNDEGTIDDVTGREMLETIEKGVYKTLVARRDDAKAIWEEEDDDASYGEYKALTEAVALLEAFLHQAPKARYTGLRRNDRYDGYGRRY